MRKCLVGFSHAMNVFLLLHRGTAAIGRIEQLVRKLVDHSLFATSTAIGDQPADSKRGATLGIHFDRNLIVGSADTARLDFKQGLAVLNSLLEELEGFVAATLLEVGHRGVEDALSGRLLAAPH